MEGGNVWDPDFFINLFVGGKQVVIETHNLYYTGENGRYRNRIDAKKTIENYLKRMGETLASHGEHAYLVLVDSHILDGTQPHVELDIRRGGKKCVDEHWHMPRISFSGDVIDHQSYEQWKRWFGTFLSDLVENRADK